MEIGPYYHPPPHSSPPPTTLLHTNITVPDSIYIILHPLPVLHLHDKCLSERLLLYFDHNVKFHEN